MVPHGAAPSPLFALSPSLATKYTAPVEEPYSTTLKIAGSPSSSTFEKLYEIEVLKRELVPPVPTMELFRLKCVQSAAVIPRDREIAIAGKPLKLRRDRCSLRKAHEPEGLAS